MNSISMSVMTMLLVLLLKQSKADHHNNNGLMRVAQLYDSIIDLITNEDDEDYNCKTRINNLRDLLDDTFSYCYNGCMDKDSFIEKATSNCNKYKDVEDLIEITQNGNEYEEISVKLEHTTMNDCQVTKTYDERIEYNGDGLIITINVPSDIKVSKNCPGDDDDKKKHLRELNDKMGRMSCKSMNDKVDDIDIKNKFCINMEYKAVCNNDDKCGDYKGESEGRELFLDFIKQYQDLFDEATVSLEDDTFSVQYRKGLCSGNYRIRVNIEYDEDNHCISKWTDYWDDLMISDEDCDNSDDKWMAKLMTQCKYDDETEDNDQFVIAPMVV